MTKIIGLTGGIGSGKTTITRYIETKGIPVYIADDAGKRVMEHQEIIDKVNALFNNEVLLANGLLDRKKIASIVFNNSEKLAQLNNIVHPAVALDFEDFKENNKKAAIIVKESAVLFESNAYKSCDFTILITAPEDIRIQRVIKRDGVSKEEVLNRIKNQMSEEEKELKANFVVQNIELNNAFLQIDSILDKILIQ
ncbi:dephospho-CoA kinase [Flavobacterium sp. xlx-214]|uniref:dephospho-CoA kinase n=1 Tax=unclassified Flavobacterium TaxID=196869 RepID=UPI0013D7A608|nr:MULTISPECIES: dephospho-CoA kinase [unclassified Flavobacterium]MBA5793733.1 dephospho-CoA kinase [Flavobacterium sp. xlx-221]QMI83246.1 dephospho-CoA kinase [Flavobacterium sp. xlx-214]